ncbi:MAG TPA: hypothetical protein V6D23_14855 [Candidatus Obscuribacterales bacterium]
MKRKQRFTLHLSLVLGLGLLVACQSAPTVPQHDIQREAVKSANQPLPLAAQARFVPSPKGQRLQLKLSGSDFHGQALGCGLIASLEVEIKGIGLPPVTFSASQNTGLEPSCNFSSDPLTDIPVGKARIVTVKAFDSSLALLGGIKSAVDITADGSNSFEVSYRTHVTARILEELIYRFSLAFTPLVSPRRQLYASRLNLPELQAWVDSLIGVSDSESFPNYTYSPHPLLIRPAILADAIEINQGQIPSNPPENYLDTPANVNVLVNGIDTSKSLKVIIRDPNTTTEIISNPGSFASVHVDDIIPNPPPSPGPAGEYLPTSWNVRVINGTNTAEQYVSLYSGENTPISFDFNPLPAVLTANWVRRGPNAGNIKDLVRDIESTLVIATEGGGVFMSTNNGNSWTEANTGLSTHFVTALASNPANANEPVYVGTADGKVYKRNFFLDETSWTLVGTGAVTIGQAPINKLFVDPGTLNRVYAGGYFEGVWECLNTSATTPVWTSVNFNIADTSFPVTGLAKDSSNNYYVSFKGGGVYKTTTPGAPGSGWAAENTNLSGSDLDVMSLNLDSANNHLQLGTANGTFFATLTSSLDWSDSSSVLNAGSFVQDLISESGSAIYAATSQGLFKAGDVTAPFGEPDGSWQIQKGPGGDPFPSINPPTPKLTSLLFHPLASTTIIAGTAGSGISYWDNTNQTWGFLNSGLQAAKVNAFVKGTNSSTQLFSATSGGGVFHSNDGGSSWLPMLNAASPTTGADREVTSLAVHEQSATSYDVFMGTSGDGVYYLDDETDALSENDVWTALDPTNLPDKNIRSLLLVEARDVLLAGTDSGGLYKICAPGAGVCTAVPNWAKTGNGTVLEALALALKPGFSDFIYAGGQQKVYVNTSLMGGGFWVALTVGDSGQKVVALGTSDDDPTLLYAGMNGKGAGFKYLYKSQDSGGSFAPVGLPAIIDHVNALLVDPDNADRVFIGTNDGVYLSTDGGTSWAAFDGGTAITGTFVNSLYLDGTMLYAGTAGRSVFLTDLSFEPPII